MVCVWLNFVNLKNDTELHELGIGICFLSPKDLPMYHQIFLPTFLKLVVVPSCDASHSYIDLVYLACSMCCYIISSMFLTGLEFLWNQLVPETLSSQYIYCAQSQRSDFELIKLELILSTAFENIFGFCLEKQSMNSVILSSSLAQFFIDFLFWHYKVE